MLFSSWHGLAVEGSTPALEATWPNNGESVDAQPILQWTAFTGAVRCEVVVDDDAYPPVLAFSQFTTETIMSVEVVLKPDSYIRKSTAITSQK